MLAKIEKQITRTVRKHFLVNGRYVNFSKFNKRLFHKIRLIYKIKEKFTGPFFMREKLNTFGLWTQIFILARIKI